MGSWRRSEVAVGRKKMRSGLEVMKACAVVVGRLLLRKGWANLLSSRYAKQSKLQVAT
jgi:hypothetical protein